MPFVARPASSIVGQPQELISGSVPLSLAIEREQFEEQSEAPIEGSKSFWLASGTPKEWSWPTTLTLYSGKQLAAEVTRMWLSISNDGRWELKYYMSVYGAYGYTKVRLWWDPNAYDSAKQRLLWFHDNERTFPIGNHGIVDTGENADIRQFYDRIDHWSRPVNGFLEK